LLNPKAGAGLLRARHGAVDDHALGEADGGLRVDVLANDVLGMGQAMAGGVLDAPCPALRAPFHLGPEGAADGKMLGGGVDAADFNHAETSTISHIFLLSPPNRLLKP